MTYGMDGWNKEPNQGRNGSKYVNEAQNDEDRTTSDYISRQAAKEAYCKHFCTPGVLCPDTICKEVHEAFDGIPSAQPERKRGKWIDDICSVCGNYVYHGDAKNFCPNCGADMREVSDD